MPKHRHKARPPAAAVPRQPAVSPRELGLTFFRQNRYDEAIQQ